MCCASVPGVQTSNESGRNVIEMLRLCRKPQIQSNGKSSAKDQQKWRCEEGLGGKERQASSGSIR